MNTFSFISKYFWLLALAVTAINALAFRRRAGEYIAEKPELKKGYETLFRGYLFWMSAPWVVMGIGCTVGSVPSVWQYLRPRDGNPYVLAWFGTVLLLWAVGTIWLFFLGGAETLAQHPGVLVFQFGPKSREVRSPALIKMLWLLALAGGTAGAAMMWWAKVPIPKC